jgi:hypothetical protein
MWAFGYGADEAAHIWDAIPLDSDIVITHTPPKYHCDETKERSAAGCPALREALWRVRPRLAICGHVHEGRGVERIRWDIGGSNFKYREECVKRWEDPGKDNKKMSLVDLTDKGGGKIQNDGSSSHWNGEENAGSSKSSGPVNSPASSLQPDSNTSSEAPVTLGISRVTTNVLTTPTESLTPASRGHGGIPLPQRCDPEALSGRLGHRETCVVNAAIMASSWPHGPGGKRFNKPIVVDIDLPLWEK